MTTYTREERAERVSELKRSAIRRCTLETLGLTMDPPETWQALIEQEVYAGMVERYLRAFVAPDEKNDCPYCGYGFFGWGIVHGQGTCSCGWPATLYHFIYDRREDDDLVCAREKCGHPRGEHVPTPVVWQAIDRSATREEIVLRCPIDSPFRDAYRPPLVVRFNRLLWAHPFTVHLQKGARG